MAKNEKSALVERHGELGMYMTFQTGDECYAISTNYVNEVIAIQPITEVPQMESYIKGLINLRGKMIPVVDIRMRFGMEPLEYTDRTCIIVVIVKSMMIGLVVEKIAEVDTIPEEDILQSPSLSNKETGREKYVTGLMKIDDKVKLVLDLEKLIEQDTLDAFEEMDEEG